MSVPDWMIDTPSASVDDLAALVARLARELRRAAPGNDLPDRAVDYLKRHGLQGSPFRAPAAQPVAAEGWQPIETAPMDETSVLIYSPREGVRSGYFAGGLWQGGAWFSNPEDKKAAQPTHWQHLPDPPTPA